MKFLQNQNIGLGCPRDPCPLTTQPTSLSNPKRAWLSLVIIMADIGPLVEAVATGREKFATLLAMAKCRYPFVRDELTRLQNNEESKKCQGTVLVIDALLVCLSKEGEEHRTAPKLEETTVARPAKRGRDDDVCASNTSNKKQRGAYAPPLKPKGWSSFDPPIVGTREKVVRAWMGGNPSRTAALSTDGVILLSQKKKIGKTMPGGRKVLLKEGNPLFTSLGAIPRRHLALARSVRDDDIKAKKAETEEVIEMAKAAAEKAKAEAIRAIEAARVEAKRSGGAELAKAGSN